MKTTTTKLTTKTMSTTKKIRRKSKNSKRLHSSTSKNLFNFRTCRQCNKWNWKLLQPNPKDLLLLISNVEVEKNQLWPPCRHKNRRTLGIPSQYPKSIPSRAQRWSRVFKLSKPLFKTRYLNSDSTMKIPNNEIHLNLCKKQSTKPRAKLKKWRQPQWSWNP
jgi:hypothetical protein